MNSAIAKFAAEVFGFFVVAAVLWRYVLPFARTAMTARQKLIQGQFDDAREAKEQAEAAEAEFKSSIDDADTETAQIIESARSQARAIVEESRVKAEQEAERIAERGRQQLTAERDSLVRELRAQTGAQVAALASRIAMELLADDARRAATVERFLTDLDERATADSAASGSSKGSS
ncbi:MAG: F0F1 ATP synthase subunit B [Mycobacteriales bacterium]